MESMSLFLSPAQVTTLYAQIGAEKTRRPAAALLLLGILAGAIIALAGAATNTAVYGIADTWTARTVCALLFPFGLATVILMGAELFTGNCLITISLLNRQCTLAGMLRNWVLVYLGNIVGAVLIALACAKSGQMDYSSGLLGAYTIKVAAGKCALAPASALVLGILCNFLVCLGVLMALSGKDNASRILGAYLPVCFFVLCGFEHSIANLYYIPAGLLAAQNPTYAALAQEAFSVDLSLLTLGGCLNNLAAVTLGNLLGGVGLGALMWYCFRPAPAPERASASL